MISVGSSYHYRINPICIFNISDYIQYLRKNRGRRGSMVVFFTTTLQSVPITNKVVSLWRGVKLWIHDEVYSIQHYMIKFVSDLRQVGGFLCYFVFLHQ